MTRLGDIMAKIKNSNGEVGMRMKTAKTPNYSGWLAKVSRVLIFTIMLSLIMPQGWYYSRIAEAAPTSDGMAAYSNNATTAVYRLYTASTNAYGAQTNVQAGVTAAQGFFVQKASKTRNEFIAGHVTTGGVLYVQRWNGSTWSAEWNVTVGGDGVNGRRFDIAYEQTSGDAMVVYSTNATGATGNEMAYRVWNGSTWAAAVTINSARLTLTGTAPIATVGAIKLAARPGSDELALAAQSYGTATANTGQLTSFIWSGSAWANEPATAHDTAMTTTVTTGIIPYDNFDLAYESVSGDLLVVWSRQGAAYNGYRTYSAATWGAATAMGGTARAAMQTIASANPNGNEIMVAYTRSASATMYGHLWSGTAMGTQTSIGANGVATATINKMWITGAWANAGGTDYGVAFWNTSTNGTIGHNTVTSGGAWGTAGTQVSGAATRLEHMNADADPYGADTIMLTWSDSAADLHARRVVVSAGPALTYTTPTGSPLTATLANITTQNFDFAYKQFAPFFSFSASNYSQAEGNSGTATITITVNRTGDTSGTNAVTYATSDGTAKTADSDYVSATNTLTFTAGQTSQTFTVTLNGDTKYENSETINLTLSSPTNGALLTSPSTGTITITNDDSQPSVGFDAGTSMGYEKSKKAVVPVSLSGATAFPVSVTYNTGGGTATAGTDYTVISGGTLTFRENETTKYVTVTIADDGTSDPGETFNITLTSPVNATLGTALNTATIIEKWPSTVSSCGDCHASPPLDGTRSGATGSVVGDHQAHDYVCGTCHVTPSTMTAFNHRNGNIQLKAGATAIQSGYYDKSGNAAYDAGTDDTFAQTNTPTTATCRNIACHGANNPTPQWGVGTATCISCHNAIVPALNAASVSNGVVTERGNAVAEFGLAWGHKKTGRNAVADADCIACHLEGNFTSQKASTYHGDGYIDLRDPDVAGETRITNIAGTSYRFVKFSTSYAAGARTSTGHTAENVDNILTQKFCLKCHDTDGALNTTARSSNGGTGTAAMPFGGIALGSNYTATNGAIGTQGLINVKAQFTTTYSSVHPVLGPLNRDFPTAARLAAPYNNQVAGRVDAGGVKTLSVVLNCFDCHNTPTTPLTARTIVAHGSAQTLRGNVYTNPYTLCQVCHTGYTLGDNHGAGSAMAMATGRSNEGFNSGCYSCHGDSGDTDGAVLPTTVRPVRAQGYHGFNTLVGGGVWPTGGGKPYGFIRNTVTYAGTGYHRPKVGIGELPSDPLGGTCSGGTGCAGNGGVEPYTPGGQY